MSCTPLNNRDLHISCIGKLDEVYTFLMTLKVAIWHSEHLLKKEIKGKVRHVCSDLKSALIAHSFFNYQFLNLSIMREVVLDRGG